MVHVNIYVSLPHQILRINFFKYFTPIWFTLHELSLDFPAQIAI
ncbi:hypothetical protein SAMN04515672_1335 [Natronorubrum texcoconense]|uniref:Uncharacterized protein n=1 Tax=Natronorubrum texcoconense TaxID=1095776 RepID=A0A1G8VGU6_9EURY|nr:hypothetical protein SAMN04515672_1335 [Natronorubrum texcoconense]